MQCGAVTGWLWWNRRSRPANGIGHAARRLPTIASGEGSRGNRGVAESVTLLDREG